MSDSGLPPPPRDVIFTRYFGGSQLLAALVTGLLVVLIATSAVKKMSAYARLVRMGRSVPATVTGTTESRGRSTSYRVSLRIPNDPYGADRTAGVDESTYRSASIGSSLDVTVDPSDFGNYVLGTPTSDELRTFELYWCLGIAAVLVAGGCAVLGIRWTASTEFGALARWECADATIRTAKSAGTRDSSLILGIYIDGANPSRRTVTFNPGFKHVELGSKICVLYNPEPGSSEVRPVAGIRFVAVRGQDRPG